MMAAGQPFEHLLGRPEGGAQCEALAVVAGQLGEGRQNTFGGELRRPGQMQRP
jgi:hypothetical protein